MGSSGDYNVVCLGPFNTLQVIPQMKSLPSDTESYHYKLNQSQCKMNISLIMISVVPYLEQPFIMHYNSKRN